MTTTETAAPLVLVDRDGPVGILTLNRPNALNAVNAEVSAAVGAALAELDADPTIRACVITGAGRAFSAGADLKAVSEGRSFLDPDHPERGFAGIASHFVNTPLIAAVNGVAFGGGTEIVLACDVAVMSNQARLGLPEVTRGLFAAAGGALRLPEQIPPKIAAEAILTGEPISAEKALQWGLVNYLTEPEDTLPRALELAHTIAANAPVAVAASKRLMTHRHDFGSDWSAQSWAANDAAFAAVLDSDDAKLGTTAFAAKTAPQWTGR